MKSGICWLGALLMAGVQGGVGAADLYYSRDLGGMIKMGAGDDGTLVYRPVSPHRSGAGDQVTVVPGPDGMLALLERSSYLPGIGGGEWTSVQILRPLGDAMWEAVDTPAVQALAALKAPPTAADLAPAFEEAARVTEGRPELFRLADPSFVKFFGEVSEENWRDASGTLAAMRAADPDSLFLRICELDLCVRQSDGELLRRTLPLHEAALAAGPIPLFRNAPAYYRLALAAWDAQLAGKRVVPAAVVPGQRPGSWTEYTDFTGRITLDSTLAPIDTPLLLGSPYLTNFLSTQTFAKQAVVRADFFLLAGRVDAALAELHGSAQHGLALSRTDPSIIGDLIGVAVGAITLSRYESAFLNAFDEADQLASRWNQLDSLWLAHDGLGRGRRGWEPYMELSDPAQYRTMNTTDPPHEARIRARVVHTRWALVHSTVAAYHEMLRTGQFPPDATRLGLLLPAGAHPDPFSTKGARLIADARDPDMWTLRSVGPDGTDDGAAVSYDPTNGTISGGDIFVTARRARKYPFPVTGEPPPKSADDLLARYPNGLPPDGFADERGASYIISRRNPPVVWSVGPDVDSTTWVDMRQTYTSPAEVPSHLGLTRIREGVWRGAINAPTEPFYDPTNGTISEGNLYMVFPR